MIMICIRMSITHAYYSRPKALDGQRVSPNHRRGANKTDVTLVLVGVVRYRARLICLQSCDIFSRKTTVTDPLNGRVMSFAHLVTCIYTSAALTLLAFDVAAATIPVSHFFSHHTVRSPQLSPSGHYLSVITTDSRDPGYNRIGIYDLKNHRAYRALSTRDYSRYGRQLFWNTHWVDDNHIVAEMASSVGFGNSILNGRIYAINVGKQTMQLLQGPHSDHSAGYVVLNWLRNSRHFILTASVPPSTPASVHDTTSPSPKAYRVNIRPKELPYDVVLAARPQRWVARRQVMSSPLPNGRLLTDNTGAVRIARGWDPDSGRPEWVYRRSTSPAATWKRLSPQLISRFGAGPVGFTADNKDIYLLDFAKNSMALSLYRFDPDTGKKTVLLEDPDSDIDSLIYGFDHKTIIGVTLMPGRPVIKYLKPNDNAAIILKAVKAVFPKQHPSLISWSQDHSKVVVKVASDRNPGQFYLFDAATGHLRTLFKFRPDIKPDNMATMRPITFKARDDTVIHGYLTLPISSDTHHLPMIVAAHGGPFRARDRWGFKPMVQFLSSRGYAVLQVNFRGSSGYGWDFIKAGFKNWGTTMPHDIIDGTRWAIRRGYADPSRICIFGTSYGGYAAVRSAELAPDLYRCTVSYAGVYDLSMLYKNGDLHKTAYGHRYLDRTLGHSLSRLHKNAATRRVKQLTGGLLLIQGGKDKRAPPAQVEAMIEQLDRAKKAYQYIYKPNEAHGFRSLTNQRELARKLNHFFSHWIGPR